MRPGWAFAIAAAGLLAGCAGPAGRWADQVGHYTYAQALGDFGRPTLSNQLPDGTLLLDWFLARPSGAHFWSYPVDSFPRYPYYYGPNTGPTYNNRAFAKRHVFLIFGPDLLLRHGEETGS